VERSDSSRSVLPEQLILDAATDILVESEIEHLRQPSEDWYWIIVDKIGPYASISGAFIVLIIFLVASFGGQAWSWVGNFLVLPLVLFLLYIPYLLRRYRRERLAIKADRLQKYRVARSEVARMVVNQSKLEASEKEH